MAIGRLERCWRIVCAYCTVEHVVFNYADKSKANAERQLAELGWRWRINGWWCPDCCEADEKQ